MISILLPKDLRELWPMIEPMLQSFIESDLNKEYTAEDLLKEGLDGKRDFWIVFKVPFEIQAVMSTYMTTMPLKKIWFCHVLVGEQLHEWIDDLMRIWEREARLANCNVMQAIAKRGMARMLERYGWHQLSVVVERPVAAKDET